MSAKDANLTQAELRAAKRLLASALEGRGLPIYSPEERLVLAILAADHSRQQSARGKKSKSVVKEAAKYRRLHVNVLLRSVIEKRYRQDAKSLATVMRIVDLLDGHGIEASESQVRRDIDAA